MVLATSARGDAIDGVTPNADGTEVDVNFGFVAIGGEAKSITLQIENKGTAPMNIGPASLAAPFASDIGEGIVELFLAQQVLGPQSQKGRRLGLQLDRTVQVLQKFLRVAL